MGQRVEKVEEAGAPAMPRSHVLSYVATVTTPTHVRDVAARAMRMLGVLHAILAMGPIFVLLIQMPGVVGSIRRAPRGGGIDWDHLIVMVIAAGIPVSLGVLFFACAGPVQRGRKAGCVIGKVGLVPAIFEVLFGAALTGCFALMNGLGLFGAQADRAELMWLLLVPVLGAVATAMFDVWGFLNWIMQSPASEKPSVAFLG